MNDNSAKQWDATLEEASAAPGRLPEMLIWLNEPRSEAAQAQYALLILKKHFAKSGLNVKLEEIPTTWSNFNWVFYVNVDPFIRNGSRAATLRGMLDELIQFYGMVSGEFFASNLLGFLESFIDRNPPYSFTVSLLPQAALDKLPEMDEILEQRHEEYLRRMDQMSY